LKVISGKEDNIFFNDRLCAERRVRTYVYNMLLEARNYLPKNYNFVVYEAYRPLARQVELWERRKKKMLEEKPDENPDSEEFIAKCNVFIANPYRQGSGHQSGAAIDVSLVDDSGVEYDMGGVIGGFNPETATDSPNISETARKNRDILRYALEKTGFVNYPPEWWHFSFGDRLWARLTGSKIAIFAKLEI